MTVLEVVAVYRQCKTCGVWKTIGCFKRNKRCSNCYRAPLYYKGPARSRTLALTDKGRAAVREMGD